MSVYIKVLETLDKKQSSSTKYNALVKLRYNTEDYILRDLILVYSGYLSEAMTYEKSKLYTHLNNCIQASRESKQRLIDYCQQQVMTKKPEWQILAERHGWRPPV